MLTRAYHVLNLVGATITTVCRAVYRCDAAAYCQKPGF